MTTRILVALVVCSFTIAAGCGSMDEPTPPQDEHAAASVDATELQSFALSTKTCQGKKPKNLGESCGCGNTVQCNGTCSGGQPMPADYGQSCGCGNTVQCNGTCSGGQPMPADYDQPCGCGGKVLCNGTCSIPCPL